MSLVNRNKIGVLYGAVTIALVATTLGSMQCWASQVGPWSNHSLRDNCLFFWVVSGALLTLSQIVFSAVALGAASVQPPGRVTKVVIVVFATVILSAIALFVVALSQMPS